MSDNTNNLEEWFIKNMPEGTVIGDPKWWDRKIVNVIAYTAPEVEQEPVMKVASNGNQLSIQKPDGGYWDMSKHVGQVFYTTPQGQSARIAELEAQLAEAKKDAERYSYLQSLAKFGYNRNGFYMTSGNWDKESIEQMKVESNFYIDKAIDEFLKGEK